MEHRASQLDFRQNEGSSGKEKMKATPQAGWSLRDSFLDALTAAFAYLSTTAISRIRTNTKITRAPGFPPLSDLGDKMAQWVRELAAKLGDLSYNAWDYS